ncbi:hypothetical protein GW931_01515 [archaeon]|nr:hypothetical protein [archaeon]PJC45475.1 MAG: hypothetical protein CO037_01295 [Candidatus Pacearchaeota archaeon CG_4_9_14_0_2_um_filter_30_8]
MKLTLKDKIELINLSEKASDLLIKVLEEKIPKKETPTKNDVEFQRTLTYINKISPLLSEGYTKMYNYIQEKKLNENSTYLKKLTKNDTN